MQSREEKISSGKLTAIQYAILAIFLVLGGRLWQLQIARGEEYDAKAENNRVRAVPILAPRGKIYDREGRLLVDNYPSFSALLLRDYPRDLIGYVSSKNPGSKVKLTLMRDGREITVNATLAERQLEGGSSGEKGGGTTDEPRGKIGISVAPLTPQVRKSLGIDASVDGLYVDHVKEISPAYDANIRDGDIITQVNGRAVTSTDEFAKLVKAAGRGDYLRLYVFRPQAKVSFFALVKIGD